MRLVLLLFLLLNIQNLSAQYNGGFNNRVFFDTSDFHLNEKDYEILNAAANLIKAQPGTLLLLTGHTDTTGTAKFNYHLSELRLQEVQKYLLSKGVAQSNLVLVGKGELEPFYFQGKYNDRYCRRVEINQIVRVKGKILNAKTKQALPNAELNLENTSKKGLDISLSKDGTYSIILPFKKYMLLATTHEGYIASLDTFRFSTRQLNGCSIQKDIYLRPAIIKSRLTFENIYFSPGRAQVLAESASSIDNIFELLQNDPEVFIEIQGHVHQPNRDKLPKKVLEDGKQLSTNRAKAVYNELVKRGVNPERMSYRGMGSSEMKYENPQNESEEQLNRRVEILVLQME